eukprot:NODE_3001_length_1070_cov_5.280118_g2753_i0.p1 GENE.NODE_3001_length_1070_cov_5.280118_g2753_i0~~NODE_3001_length_1070_cov_5.280118_g2753_i0.p1  ORF type:complete len:197 (+),score=44.58 NODE_3001_length_1070_cov_5.280118_g2753_i0:57-593(+)
MQILNIGGFDLDRWLQVDKQFIAPRPERVHDNELQSHTYVIKPGFQELATFEAWLLGFLKVYPGVFRVKGVVNVLGDEKKYVIQGVQAMLDIRAGDRWNDPPEKRTTQIVFIGRAIKPQAIENAFQAVFPRPEKTGKAPSSPVMVLYEDPSERKAFPWMNLLGIAAVVALAYFFGESA